MLVIRLARTGKKKQAYFRVVVAEKQRAVGAKFVEILGNYNPHEKKLIIKEKEKLAEYLKNGAQPSNTLAKILKKEGFTLPKWVEITERNRPAKVKDKDKKEEKVAEAPKEETAEAPKEEAPKAAEEPKEDKAEEKPAEEVKDEKKEEK